jgi:hypothetical protein
MQGPARRAGNSPKNFANDCVSYADFLLSKMLVMLSLQKSECSWTTEADCIAEAEISLEKIVGRPLIVGDGPDGADFHRRVRLQICVSM